MSYVKGSVIQFLLSQVRTSTGSLIGGKVYFYNPGTTSTTGIEIWLDEEATSAANNPYTLDANATAQLYASGKYRIVIKDAAGVTRFDRDDIMFYDFDVPYEYDALQYGAGTFTQATIEAALAAIGTTNKVTLLLRPGSWAITGNLTITENITLKAPGGTSFAITTGKVLTINGPVDFSDDIKFTGAGTVVFGNAAYAIKASWYGFAYGTNDAAQATVNLSAVTRAIATLTTGARGGVIQLPRGIFKVDPGITVTSDHITIQGIGMANEYGPTNKSGTVLTFTAGTTGIDLSYIDGASAGSYSVLKDLTIDGGGVLAVGVLINGMVTVQGVTVGQCTAAGFKLTGAVNSTHIENSSAINNTGGTGYGIWIADNGTHLNTIMHFVNVNARSNTVGVRFENARKLTWIGGVIESNTNEGLYFYKPTGGALDHLDFYGVHVENNWAGTSNYQVVVTAQVPDYVLGAVYYLSFTNSQFASFGTARNINVLAARHFRLFRCESEQPAAGTNAINLSTYSYASEIVQLSSNHEIPQTYDVGLLNVFEGLVLTKQFYGAGGGLTGTLYPDAVFIDSGTITPAAGLTEGVATGVILLNSGSVTRQLYKIRVTYEALSAAALTADLVIATLPAKTRVVSIIADTTQKYLGGIVSAAALKVGITTGGADYLASHDVFTAAVVSGLADADMGTSMTRAAAIQGGVIPSWTAATDVSVRITTVGANTNALTQGITTFYIVTERF